MYKAAARKLGRHEYGLSSNSSEKGKEIVSSQNTNERVRFESSGHLIKDIPRLRISRDEKLKRESEGEEKETPLQVYNRRFVGMVLEMGILTKMAKMEELRGEARARGPLDSMLFFLRHLRKLREDGAFPTHYERGLETPAWRWKLKKLL